MHSSEVDSYCRCPSRLISSSSILSKMAATATRRIQKVSLSLSRIHTPRNSQALSSSHALSSLQELSDLNTNPLQNVSVRPNESDMTLWEVDMKGPVRKTSRLNLTSARSNADELHPPRIEQNSSPYKGGTFKLSVTFTNDYPFKPPTVSRFLPSATLLEFILQEQKDTMDGETHGMVFGTVQIHHEDSSSECRQRWKVSVPLILLR